MKNIISIGLLGMSSLLFGQEKLTITILGTAHHFSEKYQELQDFDQVINFIVEEKPDLICIEAIPVEDTLSLQEVLPNTMKKANQLADTLADLPFNHPFIEKGATFFAEYNFWNAYYQWYLAQEAGVALGPFKKHQRRLSNSEYGLMVFPAAQKMGTQELFAIDYRVGEKEFLKRNNLVLKKLLFRFKWKPLRLYLKTQRKYRKAEKKGELIQFINGPLFQNSFTTLIDDLPNRLPKLSDAQLIQEHWLKRNQIMAERLIATAQKHDAESVLLTVGSAHVTHIKRFLIAKGHRVITYGEVLQSQIELP